MNNGLERKDLVMADPIRSAKPLIAGSRINRKRSSQKSGRKGLPLLLAFHAVLTKNI